MLSDECKVTLAQAAANCHTRPHVSAVWRWARRGIKSAAGTRVRLEHIRIGGRIYTSLGALDRFFQAVADADLEHFADKPSSEPALSERSSEQRDREIAAADRRLAAAGI